ncbi:unnamed protein product [Gadus morhua 'NCC']
MQFIVWKNMQEEEGLKHQSPCRPWSEKIPPGGSLAGFCSPVFREVNETKSYDGAPNCASVARPLISMDEWLHSGMNNLFPINYNQRQHGPRRTLPPACINNTPRPHATAADGVRGITNIIQSDANTTAYLEPSSTLDPFLRRRSVC